MRVFIFRMDDTVISIYSPTCTLYCFEFLLYLRDNCYFTAFNAAILIFNNYSNCLA